MTRGRPVLSSTYATRLLVVPRSMPTMRDITLLRFSERVADVVDDRAQIGPHRERLLEGAQGSGALGRTGRVPRLTQRTAQTRLFLVITGPESVALRGERLPRARIEAAGLASRLRLLERLLDLEHLLEQFGRRLGLHGGALAGLATLFEAHEVFDARQRIAQRPVRGVQPRG